MMQTASEQTTDQFQIESAEGLPIRLLVDVPEAPRCVVVVVHGFKGFKEWGFFPWIARKLVGSSMAVVRFDMSRNGVGARPGELDRLDLFADDTYSTELADLRSVVSWVRSKPTFESLPIFLFGHSRGGGVVLLGAPELGEVRGVITWSAIARADRWDEETKRAWRERGHLDVLNTRLNINMKMSPRVLDDLESAGERLDILSAASRLSIPTLHIHGLADETVPASEAEEIASRSRNASLVLIANGTHTFGAAHPLNEPTAELRFAMQASLAFLNAYCRTTRIITRT